MSSTDPLESLTPTTVPDLRGSIKSFQGQRCACQFRLVVHEYWHAAFLSDRPIVPTNRLLRRIRSERRWYHDGLDPELLGQPGAIDGFPCGRELDSRKDGKPSREPTCVRYHVRPLPQVSRHPSPELSAGIKPEAAGRTDWSQALDARAADVPVRVERRHRTVRSPPPARLDSWPGSGTRRLSEP